MKKTRILSAITAMAMGVSMLFGTFSASAVSADYSPDTKYTLEELFKMSKEDFLALKGADSCYNRIKSDAEYCEKFLNDTVYGGISARLFILPKYTETKKYKANITEKEIKELLGDTVEYSMSSPICDNKGVVSDTSYWNRLAVYFPDYYKNGASVKIDDKYVTEFAKCWYCVLQVVDIGYDNFNNDLLGNYSQEIVPCDVNLDQTFDLNDVIWISKSLVKQFELSELQVRIADTNNDGKADLTDAIALSKNLLKK